MDFIKTLETFDWSHLLQRIGLGLGIIIIAYFLSRMVARFIRRFRQNSHKASAPIYIAEKMASYSLILIGILMALSLSGIHLASLAVFAGAIGVGVGLGLQGIVKEFVSGLFIIFDPNLDVGDFIQINEDLRGEIVEIGPRATRLRTNDNVNIVIPNSHLIENQVVNWTFKGKTRRIHVPFGVAYGTDKAVVRACVIKAAQSVSFTMPESDEHKTQVWLTGFGDSALNFELVVWPRPEAVRRPQSLMAAYNWAIDDALRAEGVEIPFPQMDVRVRSLFGLENDAAIESAGLQNIQIKNRNSLSCQPIMTPPMTSIPHKNRPKHRPTPPFKLDEIHPVPHNNAGE
ncbi:MAG: mechanosensitive ion channel domain-containing protein [Asticcacaulis sp.]